MSEWIEQLDTKRSMLRRGLFPATDLGRADGLASEPPYNCGVRSLVGCRIAILGG